MTPESLRVKQWRESNRDRYNQRMKEYMKARRDRKKAEAIKAGFTVTTVHYKP